MIRQTEAIPGAKTLVMGTNYSDFLGGTNNAAWKDCGMAVLEPLALLFRDEVKEIAGMLGLDGELLLRKPFPLMGLAARILGEVTPQRLSALRTADAIFSEEIREAGLQRKLYKYFPVLYDHPARGDGLRRDARSGEAALRSGGAHRGTHFGDDARRSARVLRPDADAGWKREISINQKNRIRSDSAEAGCAPASAGFFSSSNARFQSMSSKYGKNGKKQGINWSRNTKRAENTNDN